MEHYIYLNGTYYADEGYCFRHKTNSMIFTRLHLAKTDSFGNYECIEKPVEPESIEEVEENG